MNKPNVLFILADDLGWGDLSCHGSPILTPNIDRLVSEGVELTQHYVSPMCTPTRTSLLTGRYPGRFGAHATVPSNSPVLPDGYATLASMLRDEGYDTGLFGKWHLGSSPQFGPNAYGFNTGYGSLAGGVDPYNHHYKKGEYSVTWHRNGELIDETGHVTDLIAKEALAWIASRAQPWFCYVPFTAVHIPIKPTQSWLDHYWFEQFDPDPLKDLSFKKYAAYASHMDCAVGKLLERLETTGQRDNTLIVFSSDNGAINESPLHSTDQYPGWQENNPRLGSNQPFRGVKAQLYEGGIRTPTVANWRGQLRAGKVDYPVHIVDWMPTFSELFNVTPRQDPQWDGINIWPLLTEASQLQTPRTLFWNFAGGTRLGVRSGDWKLIRCATGSGRHSLEQENSGVELFNIADDPCEELDLSAEQPKLVEELSGIMAEERTRDSVSKRSDVDSPMVT